ncbi:hypothetical protein BKA66DRAFT_574458 [Pyrenochaeta sp. MPI-SDFR-AT-0127]|nr:hypothetical protein BKA66DRAFT_574458 [Pyrenochaeta sp. MPI-SDFR-AT-0127]
MSYDLCFSKDGMIHQYANLAGQSYYLDIRSNVTSYSIPAGYEDAPQDSWILDKSKPWPLVNSRTGLATLIDPNPPPPQTYLDNNNVKAAFELVSKVPESNEHVWRRPTGAVLRFIFTEAEGFDVVQEAEGDVTRSDYCVFKVLRKPGGTFYQYDYLLAKCKPVNESWHTTEVQLREQLAGTGNDSKKCYGMIQIGFDVQFYKFEGRELEKVGGKMDLVHQAQDVVALGTYLKANPLPVI